VNAALVLFNGIMGSSFCKMYCTHQGARIDDMTMRITTCEEEAGLRRVAASSNMTVDLAPFGRWTPRDKAAQRRSPLR